LTFDDLMAEVGGTDSGHRPSRRTAIHEAAHAVVIAATRPSDIIAVSVRPTGALLGGTIIKVGADHGSTSADVATMLRELLAGRAAEEMVFGGVSGGSGGPPGSDLARATMLAVSCEATWGLGKSLAWHGDMTADEAGRFISLRPDIAARVEARLAAAYAEALEMLSARRPAVEALAAALLEREVLSGDDVRAVLASVAEAARKPRIVGNRIGPEDAPRNQPGPPA
jgi:ATP-dependent Zn protease